MRAQLGFNCPEPLWGVPPTTCPWAFFQLSPGLCCRCCFPACLLGASWHCRQLICPTEMCALQHLLSTLTGTLEGPGSSLAVSGTAGILLAALPALFAAFGMGLCLPGHLLCWDTPNSCLLRYCPGQKTAKYEEVTESKYTLSRTMRKEKGVSQAISSKLSSQIVQYQEPQKDLRNTCYPLPSAPCCWVSLFILEVHWCSEDC